MSYFVLRNTAFGEYPSKLSIDGLEIVIIIFIRVYHDICTLEVELLESISSKCVIVRICLQKTHEIWAVKWVS